MMFTLQYITFWKHQCTWKRNNSIQKENNWGTCNMPSRFRQDLFTCGCCWIHRRKGVTEAASCITASHGAIGLRVTDTTVSAWVAASSLVAHVLVSEKLIEFTKDTFCRFFTSISIWCNTRQMEIGRVDIEVVNTNGWELLEVQSIKSWLWLLTPVYLPDKSSQLDMKWQCYWCTLYCNLSRCTWKRGSISVVVWKRDCMGTGYKGG